MSPTRDGLAGLHVLVVEDEYFAADDLCRALTGAGAVVVGPAATVDTALALLAGTRPDVAVLDVNLGGTRSFPVADALDDAGVPYLFATGYDAWALPGRYAAVERCEKPVDVTALTAALARLARPASRGRNATPLTMP